MITEETVCVEEQRAGKSLYLACNLVYQPKTALNTKVLNAGEKRKITLYIRLSFPL